MLCSSWDVSKCFVEKYIQIGGRGIMKVDINQKGVSSKVDESWLGGEGG